MVLEFLDFPILTRSVSVPIENTSNMAAWFCAQFNDAAAFDPPCIMATPMTPRF